MDPRGTLVRLLADGELHDEESLARSAGLERTTLLRELRALATRGLDIESSTGRGHRLGTPLDLLEVPAIEAGLDPRQRAQLDAIEVLDEVDSTNARLLKLPAPAPGRWRACLAEFQNAGRGRRGRGWTQPFASGLCLSFSWSFAVAPTGLSALSLAAGVAVLRALKPAAVAGLALKWPNDVLRDGCKLGGILCEVRSDPGSVHVVIGIGLNVRLSADARASILEAGGVEPADLADVAPPVRRSALAARLLDALVAMAGEFAQRGFGPFAGEWRAADALRDRAVRVQGSAGDQEGIARGIDGDGALCLEIRGQVRHLTAGDVSLRAVA